jgi:four helix bundle protein
VYSLTKQLPQEEKYDLSSQIRRSALSIPSNIAEGAGRNSIKENIHFLYNVLGSLSENETQFLIAQRIYKLYIKQLEQQHYSQEVAFRHH